ncbi:hypothetical protein [Pseudomonas phage Itty13]|uniref:Uncharacterized protein n=1 Tax=Pseudomonas phage Itty13 TaxID=2805750 RepID=A0A889IQU6_9CAUD|nr:virion structural protein [Pseudomonas phage Itty13]QRE00580.1 hypothetical protein [Pseudomonas phage Itty13]
MAGNFGIGVGAFMAGLNQGVQAYDTIQKARDRKALRDIATQGTDAAKAAREADIGRSINVGSRSENGVTVPTYEVGGQSYASEGDARAAAEKQVGSFMDYYAKSVLPKYQEHWMQTGDVEKAQALEKWMQDQNVQKGVKAWAGAVRAFQTGDREAFKKNLMAAYNQQGYFQDGMEAVSIDDVKDDKGNLLGYKIKFKDPKGKVTEQTYDGEDVARLGLNALSPAEVLSYGVDQLKQAQAARAELAKENRKFQRDIQGKSLDQAYRLEAQGNASNLRRAEEAEKLRTGAASTKVRDAEAVSAWLKSQGYSDDFIRAQAPRLVGIEAQQMSPQNRLNSILETLNKSLDFQDLSDDEKVRRAYDVMKMQDELLSKRGGSPGSAPSGAPAAAAPVQSGRGIPVWDNKTNSLIYR